MSLYVDVHALHTLPPSNINRDDTGAPKTATFGGVVRQRVSSQAWKRAIRRDFPDHLDASALGIRTKRVAERVIARVQELTREQGQEVDREQATKAVTDAFIAAGIKLTEPKARKGREAPAHGPEAGYLLFLSNHQIQRLAEAVVAADGQKLAKKDVAKILDQDHSMDIALFGRMVAEVPDYNVDAAVQVAHAIGVHASEPEFDYFTAVDDAAAEAEETGAGMIGTVEMMSSTLYRYATVNMAGLAHNLGDAAAAVEAALAFVRGFVLSMPTGKQNTFANRTLPDVVVVTVRDDRPVSYVNAFETPVETGLDRGRRYEAARRMAQEAASIETAYGMRPVRSFVLAVGPLAEAVVGMGEPVGREQLLAGLREALEGARVPAEVTP